MTKNIISLCLFILLGETWAYAQDAVIARGKRDTHQVVTPVTQAGVETTLDTDYFTWQKTYYRRLDLANPKNSPLAYPPPSENPNGQNLFAMIFTLAAEGKIKLYEYLDGEERLSPQYELSFADLLSRFGLSYNRPEDIPHWDLKAYYIKELNYFDQSKSYFGRSVLALCPILYQLGEYGETPKPLFWVKYQDIKPYLTDIRPLSPQNEAVRGTYDDFFRLGMYEGSIVKTLDFLGRSLNELNASPESLGQEQKALEVLPNTIKKTLTLPDSVIEKSTQSQRRHIKKKREGATKQSARSPKPASRSVRGLS